ncbi:MAG TPA: hypothetical protein VNJ28_05620, partial [Candidatus Limnocylindrales bacterium]|nr:hypothetical protein [Candidatus Limnocylindrales bacterium]
PPTPAARRLVGRWLERAELLGRRTAELHACLASGEDFAFRPEPWTPDDGRAVLRAYRALADSAFGLLEARLGSLAGRRAEEARRALALRERLVSRVAELETAAPAAVKVRIHGDLHAGQVLDTGTDFAFIDFEGEPARPVAARRAKRSALVDVAGMLRSFHYAAFGGLLRSLGESPPPERWAALAPATRAWYAGVAAAYLRGYLRAAEGAPFLPASREDLVRLLDAFLVEKATYELAYELNNRPAWLPIPLEGLLELAEG